MSDKRRLIYAFVQFLNREMESDEHSEDAKESLEVASQCLQTAFAMSAEDKHLAVTRRLEDVFKEVTANEPMRPPSPASVEDKEKAEKLKSEGNDMMKAEKFDKALELYTKAIELDPAEKIFYCNRAAAHSRLNNHYAAVEDCQRALDMDPKYSKAYGRMGLAYSSLEKHKEAVDCFTKALELEPSNESYRSNLSLAREKLQTTGSPGPNPFGAGPGGLDLGSLLNNQGFMNMATSLLSDPNMQNMMGQFMQGGMGPPSGGNSIDGILQAGQRLAEQMQQSNPELVEQLRRHMQPPGGSDQDGSSGGSDQRQPDSGGGGQQGS